MFTGSLPDIAATELRIVIDSMLPGAVTDIERITFGRARLLRFASSVGPDILAPILGQLSSTAALFVGHASPDGPDADTVDLLRPVLADEALTYGSELVTTQRYRGKTSERLTRAMLNCGLAAAGINPADPTGTILDPMCGRGTTLNWALAYGLSSVGMDADRGAVDQHATFLETWAKRARLPHKAERFKRNNKESRVFTIRLARDRAALTSTSGATTDARQAQIVQTFNADAADRGVAIRRGSVDVIVTDLPYGVQHRGAAGRHGADKGGDTDAGRETPALVERMLPVWHRHLRPGGSICLAWNTKRAARRELTTLLTGAGFSAVTIPGGFSMRHVVDASIDRDVIVAVKAR